MANTTTDALMTEAAARALEQYTLHGGERRPSDPERVREFNEANAQIVKDLFDDGRKP